MGWQAFRLRGGQWVAGKSLSRLSFSSTYLKVGLIS